MSTRLVVAGITPGGCSVTDSTGIASWPVGRSLTTPGDGVSVALQRGLAARFRVFFWAVLAMMEGVDTRS